MDIPWGTVATALLSGGGILGVAFTAWQKIHSDRTAADLALRKAELERDQAEHKIEREALALQVAAQATAQGAVEVERAKQETIREVGADQIDLTRGSSALDRIRELEARVDSLTRDVGRRDAAVTHWKDATLEVARYARSIEDGFNLERSPRVAELLLGTEPPDWTAEVVAAAGQVQPTQPTQLIRPASQAPILPPSTAAPTPIMEPNIAEPPPIGPTGRPPLTH